MKLVEILDVVLVVEEAMIVVIVGRGKGGE